MKYVRPPHPRSSTFSGGGTNRSRLVAEQQHGQDEQSHCPPGYVLDKIADEKLWGGYKRSDVCKRCNLTHPKNVQC
jgi:hypothetical protein